MAREIVFYMLMHRLVSGFAYRGVGVGVGVRRLGRCLPLYTTIEPLENAAETSVEELKKRKMALVVGFVGQFAFFACVYVCMHPYIRACIHVRALGWILAFVQMQTSVVYASECVVRHGLRFVRCTGTNYYGLQETRGSMNLPTIEGTLESALHRWTRVYGCK
jgi:hypothetical protein